ncbi:MAG: folylpolyglutamate synthase/dihydrofolate synthase family protein [Candidatus Omnitrophota bacterium]
MTFQEAQGYLNSFIDYEKLTDFSYQQSFKVERIKKLLSILDNPQEKIKFIHIAGTKGKGSTCAFIAYILRRAGFKTGLYTSPHLGSFRERIRILSSENNFEDKDFEGSISEPDICKYVEKLKIAIEKFIQQNKNEELSFFEVYTALALLYFKEKNVDFAVLETGIGGRLDATNVVDALVCGITPISFEHTQRLGKTLTAIAKEKAGIIKNKNQIVVSASQPEEALNVIKERCKEFDAKLYLLNKDIFFEEISSDINGQVFNCFDSFSEYTYLRTGLLGNHQLINAATAIGIVDSLRLHSIIVSADAIKKGLDDTIWPGRFEIINRNSFVILDGAQNIASAKELKETINKYFGSKKVILVLGISQDKDIKGICKELEPISKTIILTKADHPRALVPEKMKEFFGKNKEIKMTSSVKEALELSKSIQEKTDIILVTGSLFVVGEARNYERTVKV